MFKFQDISHLPSCDFAPLKIKWRVMFLIH